MHSLEATLDGCVIASAAPAHASVHTPHRMYSVAKSLTGLVVLALAEEGRIDLDDPIARFFPEAGSVPRLTAETRIRDVLAMRGPHARTTYREEEGDWLASYFRVAPTHRAGTLFTYDTSGSYALSALVERVERAPLEDVFRARIFAPLGAGRGMRVLTGPEGIGHGGSGLICTPRDLLTIATEVTAGGGRAFAPSVVRQALARASDAATQTWGGSLRAGYGAQIWLPPGGGWMMFGLGGQVAFGDPARGLVLVVTANAQACQSGDQRLAGLVRDAARELDPADPAPALEWPAPAHDPARAVPGAGAWGRIAGEGAPGVIRAALGRERAEIEAGELRLDVPLGVPAPVEVAGLGRGVATAGWSGPGVLDVVVDISADDIARLRARFVATADGLLTVQAQGFGPAVGRAHTWVGTFRPDAQAG
nr:serine hydrolase domain-containing protein [Microbacterium excoecariae]